MQWTRVPQGMIGEMVDVVLPLIDTAIRGEYSGITADDLMVDILDGGMQLWTNGRAIAVTEIVKWRRAKALRVNVLAGDGFEAWRDELDNLFGEFARHHGCDGIEVIGRRGWSKSLRGIGYEDRHAIMWRPLKGGSDVRLT